MEDQLITLETAKLAKEKGFDWKVISHYRDGNLYDKELIKGGFLYNMNCKEEQSLWDTNLYSAPTQSLLQKWLRDERNIDVYVMPVFRDKVGYDEFARDGYTFEIIRIEPSSFLMWSDFNVCAEDRDDEIKEEGVLKCLKPSVKTYEKALEIGLIEALKLIEL